ncbi:CehA/McbA family metallohydrolase [Duganella alba]|uniref:CehA/McbA family metallohydrolase n=1 Tax=Duganella alba TaxID=2666081 RepID=UPI00140E298F|nr:CehA/McbA family metallohydrolase [Duganella alba]
MRKNFMLSMVLVALMRTLHAAEEEHGFDAELQTPFHADSKGIRTATMQFSAPAAGPQKLRWQLELLPRHDDTVVRTWRGKQTLAGGKAAVTLRWRANVPAGVYRLRLRASLEGGGEIEQSWPVAVDQAAAPPAIAAGATPPYDIYLGNLHSQTNHSDGGGALDHCTGAQEPQSGAFGPSDAYAYAQQHGLDFLMTSEHNHMYDGSDGTNQQADADAARALFQDGLRQAASWRDGHSKFLALYGQEWGVINHGGHLNLLNADALLGWERNAQGDLLADQDTPKNDYNALYTLMRGRGWFGQFNHPQHDQFAINGKPLAWTGDGDVSMLLCEVMNSSAFSSKSDESETRHSNFEAACNSLLEAGYHLAFSSNQDNHCANWGAAYSNRTAVLLPRNTPLTPASLLEALQARRVYATMDKHAQLIFTANGHMMGERIQNRGKLTLQARYSSDSGRSIAAVSIFQGVPGRNGKVAALGSKLKRTLTPLPGEHFYYARVTQDDGKMLWSAPIWVTQSSP